TSLYAKSNAFLPLPVLSRKAYKIACLYLGAKTLHEPLNTLACWRMAVLSINLFSDLLDMSAFHSSVRKSSVGYTKKTSTWAVACPSLDPEPGGTVSASSCVQGKAAHDSFLL